MRETEYARELASASVGEARIERIHVKELEQDEIRFSWWKDGRMVPRPLDLPEDELLELLQSGLNAGVFTDRFVLQLARILLR